MHGRLFRSESIQAPRSTIRSVECEDGGFIMRTRNLTCLAGLALLLTCGSALAHDRVGYVVHPSGGWSGALTIYGDSHGYSGWSGGLNYTYGINYGYAPGYVPWTARHRHGPACGHWAGHRYGKAYRKGYRHGRAHAHKAGHRHRYRH
jgi:hypothetical protein